jgi:two-component system KDP operon response regulator KdpE
VQIDLAGRSLATAAGTQQLTPTEVRLLQVLIANLDRPVSTELLLDRVWSDADGADPSYVWVSMRRLRRKLEQDPDKPRFLLTERGIGYRLASTG